MDIAIFQTPDKAFEVAAAAILRSLQASVSA
jgi:hypothetical protein